MQLRLRSRVWVFVSLAWVIPALLGALNSIAQSRIWGGPLDYRAVVFTGLDWLLYGAITPFVFWLSARLPLTRARFRARLSLHLLFAIACCAAWAGGGTLLKMLLQPHTFDGGIVRFSVSWFFVTLPFGVSVYLLVMGVEHGLRYLMEAQQRDVQLARISAQLDGAKLAALQAQLRPHFLFNALNTATVLVKDGDRKQAASVLELLSDVLRRILSGRRNYEVPLREELDLVRRYLAVEQARFSDRLRPEFCVDPAVESMALPSFALQHLVENAVRHGIARRTASGKLVVSAKAHGSLLELTVTDDGPGVAVGEPNIPGHGLAETRERLRTLYGDRASLTLTSDASGTHAVLRVPLRECVDD
jgi:two-component system LytT family sensor kinase